MNHHLLLAAISAGAGRSDNDTSSSPAAPLVLLEVDDDAAVDVDAVESVAALFDPRCGILATRSHLENWPLETLLTSLPSKTAGVASAAPPRSCWSIEPCLAAALRAGAAKLAPRHSKTVVAANRCSRAALQARTKLQIQLRCGLGCLFAKNAHQTQTLNPLFDVVGL